MIVPIQKNRIFEEVSKQMIAHIESGDWKAGEKIIGEIELSKEFQVSRNSIREAMKALQMAGILEAKSGLGTFVAQDAAQKLRDSRLFRMLGEDEYYDEIIETRFVIETGMVYLAAQMCTEEDIARLERNYEELVRVTEEDDREDIMRLGHEFHQMIVDIPGNRVLSVFYESIRQSLQEERAQYGTEFSKETFGNGTHRAIIEAMKCHDAMRARALMEEHIIRKKRAPGKEKV